MIIALDANVWISERLLRSATGAGFLHAVRTLGHRILLPDVTRDEVLAGVMREGITATQKVQAGLVTMQALTGSRPEIHLPAAEAFLDAARRRINELEHTLLQIDVTLEQYRKSVTRLHEHLPPAETKEQFRDCVLWTALLAYVGDDTGAALVTNDRDFASRQAPGTLAPQLREESKNAIVLYASLGEYLEALRKDLPQPDFSALTEPIVQLVTPSALELAREHGFTLHERERTVAEVFATEALDAVAIIFEITFRAAELTFYDGSTAREARLMLAGDCIQNSRTREISEFRLRQVAAVDETGAPLPFGVVYGAGAAAIGSRNLPYRVRAPLYRGDA